ncbi:NAD(P)-dependent alcohol dehydrogenase [Aliiroseovarius sediminis]|uniref:NAD(P)-dependent alcohol dehydrogenase n=1 Tax=Aliiroseovarius sediminis TaxID=2925839 RepID=UPI001F562AA5|nr:NAD(P)-dependent alcohol dehydrogenase [Aliiroseovarius sediminis]MCI2395061.1 NAD(P)-dependent alcohol dehydrogenase [Aliiroseovarius sediminis]
MAQALVLERAMELSLRDIELPKTVGPKDVKVRTEVVGVCGSDVHYYQHGRIGPFVVDAPMVLGHEAAGVVIATGSEVSQLSIGDRVCVEPGVPDFSSRASRIGLYNLDPSLTFWATPPDHGCLTPEVVHPADLCFKLPDNVSAAQGAMVEPLAVCVQAASKVDIKPGDIAVVLGAGPIGLLQALTALSSGCSQVFIFDPLDAKLDLADQYDGITPLYGRNGTPAAQIQAATQGWGADVIFECSGAEAAFRGIADLLRPGGTLVCVGMPINPVAVDIVALQVKEITIRTVFRYANVYDRAINLLASGQIDVAPLITGTFTFEDSIAAFERAAKGLPEDVKIQIQMPD